uniref:ORFan n=1 Tax=Parastrongyloides trichosuri TaxID=131310 RepID=A0A0N5A7A6_PARTI
MTTIHSDVDTFMDSGYGKDHESKEILFSNFKFSCCRFFRLFQNYSPCNKSCEASKLLIGEINMEGENIISCVKKLLGTLDFVGDIRNDSKTVVDLIRHTIPRVNNCSNEIVESIVQDQGNRNKEKQCSSFSGGSFGSIDSYTKIMNDKGLSYSSDELENTSNEVNIPEYLQASSEDSIFDADDIIPVNERGEFFGNLSFRKKRLVKRKRRINEMSNDSDDEK